MNNLYSILLSGILENYILDKEYVENLKEPKHFLNNVRTFNLNFRTYSVSLGRKLGASSALKQFVKNHPELNFVFISTSILYEENFKKDNLKNLFFCSQKDSLKGKLHAADIVIFDVYDLLIKHKNFQGLEDLVLENLNSNCLNQIYIRFQ